MVRARVNEQVCLAKLLFKGAYRTEVPQDKLDGYAGILLQRPDVVVGASELSKQ